jgi:hypothetical protein
MPESNKFNPEELKKLLQNYEDTSSKPTEKSETTPVKNSGTASSHAGEISEDDYKFGVEQSLLELSKVREAWRNFQIAVRDLAITEVVVDALRETGEALAQVDISFADDATKCGGQRAAERIITKSKVIAAVLNKYRTTKGEQ